MQVDETQTQWKSTKWFQRRLKISNQWTRSADEQVREVSRICSCMVSDTERRPRIKSLFQTQHRPKKVCNPLATRRKVIRLLICIIVSFAVLVMPHHIRLLWQFWFASSMSFSFQHMLVPPITFLFFYANSALNPFLYALLSDHFRQAFRELLPSGAPCHKAGGQRGMMASHSRMTSQRASTVDSAARKLSAQTSMTPNGTCSMSTVL